MKQETIQSLKKEFMIGFRVMRRLFCFAAGCMCGWILCYNLLKHPVEYMQNRFAMNIVEENIEIYNFIEEKRNKVLYAGATYSKPILTIGIITEKEMTEEDKLLLNDLIKRKFKRCVDHEETLSDVQVKYLSRWDIFLPRFGTETSP